MNRKRYIVERIRASHVEQTKVDDEEVANETRHRSPASIALELGALSMRFARVERVPRYEDGRRESDVEHSYMLSLVATEIAYAFYPEVNIGLIGEYAKVHDLIEIVVGDVATFDITPEELAAKEAVEHAALDDLLANLPPYTANLLRQYERQEDIESKIVKAVDKLLPVIVNIVGQGKRIIEEDYAVSSLPELQHCHEKLHGRIADRFSDLSDVVRAHRQLCNLFEEEYAQSTSVA
jgi:5'-deoxynucleotidase YfbR-like HD superfamily hydrolase